MRSQFQTPTETKILVDFFSSFLALVDKVKWYLLLVGGGKYPMELIEERASWFRHHGYPPKKSTDREKGSYIL